MPENSGFVVREKAISDYLNYQYRTDEICITSYWSIQVWIEVMNMFNTEKTNNNDLTKKKE